MKIYLLLPVLILFSFSGKSQQIELAQGGLIPLATPQASFRSNIFQEKIEVTLDYRMDGSTIHYSVDSSEVTTGSQQYSKSLILKKSTQLKVKSFHPDYKASETLTEHFYKVKEFHVDTKVILMNALDAPYNKSSARALIDLQLGSKDFRRDTSWLGFNAKQVRLRLEFPKMQQIKSLKISLLEDQNSWIFLPDFILLKAAGDFKHSTKLEGANEQHPGGIRFIEICNKAFETDWIELRLQSVRGIPEWHPGKKAAPWFFIDEIIME